MQNTINRIKEIIAQERKLTRELLELINYSEENRFHLAMGYSSLFDWLTKYFGYSEGAAQRRIQSARLIKAVPAVAAKVESGELNITNLAKAQAVFRMEKVAAEKKIEIVAQLEGKSTREAERVLVREFPQSRKPELLTEKTKANLAKIKDLLSHKMPGASDGELLEYVTEFFLEKSLPAPAKRCVKRCGYTSATGKICGGTYQIQEDHIFPKALGGGDHPENLRYLCRAHNIYEAENYFGKKFMEKWKRP